MSGAGAMGEGGMHIRAIGTAAPPARYTKADCLAAFERSDWFARLDRRASWVAQKILQQENGIEARRLALDSLAEAFAIDPNTLARRFQSHAPALAGAAAERALAASGLAARRIDAIVVSTCTGYLCPGLSGYVAEQLQLRADVQAYDLVGQGCAAALPNLQLCQALLAGGQAEHALSVCVEVSSAAMYLDNDPGVLVSACLFGDGAGAALLARAPSAAEAAGTAGARRVRWVDADRVTDPSRRAALMFEQRDGMLRNVLTRAVPELAAEHMHEVLRTVLGRAGVSAGEVSQWIVHAGGRDVLQAIERRLELDPQALRYSAATLREYGNLSSAFVYFVLDAALRDAAAGGWWWLSSFGAGFACHGALLEVNGP